VSRVIDYAWGRPSVASLRAAAAIAVCRYLSYDQTGKTLTRIEADGLRASGIDIVSNWEQAGSWAEYSGGQAVGRTHAATAAVQHITCGGPPGRPIYFSTDWDVTAGQLATVADYYRGVASVIGLSRTGAYGGLRVIRYLFDQHVITWGWQTYAWSGGQWDPRAQLRQIQNGVRIGGVDCDLDESMAADFGQWAVATTGAGGDMAFDDVAFRWVEDAALHGWAVRSGVSPPTHINGTATTTNAGNPLWDLLRAMAADVAGVKAAVTAAQGAITALAGVVNAGGGSIDTAAILGHMDAAQATESAALATLNQQVTDLRQRLARAAQAGFDELA
jgi:hypothetical protein